MYRNRQISLETGRKDIAERRKMDVEDRISRGEDPFSPDFRIFSDAVPIVSVTTSQAVEDFLADRRLHCRPRTVAAYEEVLGYFVRHQSLQNLHPKYIKKDMLEAFLRRKDVRDSTRVSNRTKLKSFWLWMVQKGHVADNLVGAIRLPKPNDITRSRIVSEQDLEALLDTHKRRQEKIRKQPNYRPWKDEAWFRPLIILYFETGLRRAEGLALKARHLTNMESLFVEHSKTHKQRVVPISSRLAAELKEYFRVTGGRGPDDYLFASPRLVNRPISAARVVEVFSLVKKAVPGLELKNIHGLRHSRATRLIEEGYSLFHAKNWMGHSSVTTLEKYVSLSPDDLRQKQLAIESRKARSSEQGD